MLKLKKIQVKKYEGIPEMGSYPPTLHLNSDQVKEIKDWKVGDSYQIILEVRQTNMSQGEKGVVNSSFEVVAYKAMEEDYEDMSDDDLEKLQAKALGNT